jgi:hypothetical protein
MAAPPRPPGARLASLGVAGLPLPHAMLGDIQLKDPVNPHISLVI